MYSQNELFTFFVTRHQGKMSYETCTAVVTVRTSRLRSHTVSQWWTQTGLGVKIRKSYDQLFQTQYKYILKKIPTISIIIFHLNLYYYSYPWSVQSYTVN